MKLYRLHRKQYLPISITDAWNFFSNPQNLQTITPPWLDFSITSEVPEKMYSGMIISYSIKIFISFPTNWITEITHIQEPFFFVDEQRIGPYRFWHHQHIFKEAKGGVEMQDIVHYVLPFGVLGRTLLSQFIGNKLKEIFDFRREALKTLFIGNPF